MSPAFNTLQHWFFDANSFQPCAAQLKLLLDILPSADQAKVTKFRALKDQKLSLVSALIQRAMIRQTFTCSNKDFFIKRTSHNKPFATSEHVSILDWNYNVSHHGSYVTILSDPSRPMGVDLVQRSVRKTWKESSCKYITQFTSQLTFSEQAACLKHSTEWKQYTHFFVIWSLKEAYIKAVGKGLYMDLLSVSFQVTFQSLSSDDVSGTATVKIDGCERLDWEFRFSSLDAQHVVTVAKGPSVKGKMMDDSCTKEEMAARPTTPTQVQILDLLSPEDQVNWEKLEKNTGGGHTVSTTSTVIAGGGAAQ